MENFEDQKFCQSCAMPMTEELYGTNADGSENDEYCMYCFKDGEFTSDMTMEDMIDFCSEKMAEVHPDIDKELSLFLLLFLTNLNLFFFKNRF